MEKTTENRFFPEGITQCSTHDCKRKATGWLLDPEGSPIPSGHSCEPCAQMCIEEYEAKLGESWTFTPGYVYRTSGNTVRSLEKMPDWGIPEQTRAREANDILINMSKEELVDLTCKLHPYASLPILRGYTKHDLRSLIVRMVPLEVLLREAATG